MNDTPAPETVIERAIRRMLGTVHTVRIGYVERYDATTGEADVQPADMAPFRNEAGVRVPYQRAVIPHVPVYFPGGGGARDTWPVKRGDACIVLHTSVPIGRWLVQGGIVDENNDRKRHTPSNAIALVGILDFAHFKPAHASARVLESSDIRLGSQTAADPLVRKSDLDAVIDQVNALRSAYNGHAHPVTVTGTATTQSGATTGITGIGTPAASVSKPACSPHVKTD